MPARRFRRDEFRGTSRSRASDLGVRCSRWSRPGRWAARITQEGARKQRPPRFLPRRSRGSRLPTRSTPSTRDHLVEAAIELDPVDWQELRGEGRGLFDGFLELGDESFEFTEFTGVASVDGQRYANVSIRKKGYLGSLSRPRPSLKLDFGEVEDATGAEAGRVFERLTLEQQPRRQHARTHLPRLRFVRESRRPDAALQPRARRGQR